MKDVFFFTRLSEKTKETIKIVKNKQKLYGDPCWIESLSGNCRCGGVLLFCMLCPKRCFRCMKEGLFFCVRVAVEMLFVFKNSWINSRFPVVE